MQRRTKLSHDMSIEEMLKSIRGIINTHQKSKPKDEEDILELTEIVEHNKKIDDTNNVNSGNDELISSSVINESIANIKNFTKHAKDSFGIEKKLSAEELLIQLLKPQLKEWLDKNLPQLIEHMLEKEIKKLVPKNKEF